MLKLPTFVAEHKDRSINRINDWIKLVKAQLEREMGKVRVSENDAVLRVLAEKLLAGSGITLVEGNDGEDETLTIAASASDDKKVKVTSADTTADFLNSKIAAGTGITKATLNGGANEQLQLSASGFAPIDAQYLVLALNATLTAERAFVPDADDFLTTDGGANANYAQSIKRHRYGFYEYVDHFPATTIGTFIAEANNNTTSTAITNVAGRPGVTRLSTGASAAARGGFITLVGGPAFYTGDGRQIFETSIRLQQLSDGTEGFRIRCGFMQSNALAIFDGIYVQYEDDINSGKWQLASRDDNNAAETGSANFDMTVAINTWYRITLEINAAGTSVTATIWDGTTTESETLASGLTDTDESMAIGSYLYKTSGTGTVSFDCDYIALRTFAAER